MRHIRASAVTGSARSGAKTALAGAMLLSAIVLASDRLADQFSRLRGDADAVLLSLAFLIPPITLSLTFIFLVFRCRDDRAVTRNALLAVAISLVCRVVWVSVFDSYQVNDFGYYIQCGAHVVRTGSPNGSLYCESAYWKRSAFYTYPLAMLFGQSLLAIKLVNVLLASATSWIFYQTGKVMFGARTAAIALAFFVWHPDLWYAMTLASHDVPGLFWLGLFYYLCALLHRSLAAGRRSRIPATAWSAGLGGLLFFLDASRSYHYGAIAALLLCAVVHAGRALGGGKSGESGPDLPPSGPAPGGASVQDRLRTALSRVALLLVIPLGIHLVLNAGFRRAWTVQPGHQEVGLICYLTVMDVLGSSDYEEINNWYDRQCIRVAAPDRTAFAVRKVLHDLTHDPTEFLRHLQRKNRILGRDDDYIEWSTYSTFDEWDTTRGQVRRINRSRLPEQYRAVAILQIAVLACVLWRFLLFPRLPFRMVEIVPLSFSAVYYLMFLFLVESQPRYDIYLIFPFSWMAAQAVEDLKRRRADRRPFPERTGPVLSRMALYVEGGAILLCIIGAYWAAAVLVADGPLTLRDQSGFVRAPTDQIAPAARRYREIAPAFERNNHKQLMLRYPVGASLEKDCIVAVQRTFTLREKPSHHLRFFISTYSVREEPFDKQLTWEDVDLEYLVAVNGRAIASGKLNAIRDNLYCSFSEADGLVFEPRMTIQLVVRNTEKIERVEPNRGPIMSLEYIDLQ